MKTPPLLLGAALLFWGWQTGPLIIAAVMTLILEGSRLVSLRFAFSRADINRFSDLSSIIFGGMFIYLLAASGLAQSVLTLIMWLPIGAAAPFHRAGLWHKRKDGYKRPLPGVQEKEERGGNTTRYPEYLLSLFCSLHPVR